MIKNKHIYRNYYEFLMLKVFKKKSAWFLATLYVFMLCVFSFIVPAIAKQPPFILWSNPMISMQSMITYIASCYASSLVIILYKDFRDNGTELIIASKPIKRQTMIGLKSAAYLTYSVIISFVALIFGLFIFAFNVPTHQQIGYLGNVFLFTLITLIIFGAIALITSIWLAKIWVTLVPILFVAFTNIYYVVINYANVVESPVDGYLDGKTSINTFEMLGSEDGKPSGFTHYVSKLNKDDISAQFQKIFTSFDTYNPYEEIYMNQKKDYDQRVADSNYLIPTIFDFTTHIHLMANGFGLESEVNHYANECFGSDRNSIYHLNDSYIVNAFKSGNKSYPVMFLDYDTFPYISESALPSDIFNLYIQIHKDSEAIINKEKIITVGQNSSLTNGAAKLLSSMSRGLKEYAFEIEYPDSRGEVQISTDELKISNEEKAFFNAILESDNQVYLSTFQNGVQSTVLKKGIIKAQDAFTNVSQDKQTFINNNNSINWNNDNLKIWSNNGTEVKQKFADLRQFFHYCLTSKISVDGNTWMALPIHNNIDLMFEALKLKFYILMDEYAKTKQAYLNDYYEAYSASHDKILNSKHSGIFLTPYDFKMTDDGINVTANQMFYDPTYIAVSTLVKNFSFAIDKNGYAGEEYIGTDGKQHLYPSSFIYRKGGNTGNISSNSDMAISTGLYSISFNSNLVYSPYSMYTIYILLSIALYVFSYILYSRIDFR